MVLSRIRVRTTHSNGGGWLARTVLALMVGLTMVGGSFPQRDCPVNCGGSERTFLASMVGLTMVGDRSRSETVRSFAVGQSDGSNTG